MDHSTQFLIFYEKIKALVSGSAQLKGYFNVNCVKLSAWKPTRVTQTQKHCVIFPYLSYNKLHKIKVKISLKLIIRRPKYLRIFFIEN